MDFNNNSVNNNTPANNASNDNTSSLDIRDVANFLFSKIWIIALVVLCFAIVAFLWTNFFVAKQYTSTTDLFIISTIGATDNDASSTTQANNWSIGKQLTKTSKELIMGDYCDLVAKELNSYNPNDLSHPLTKALNKVSDSDGKPLDSGISFLQRFKTTFGEKGISGAYIRNHIRVSSDEETCIVAVTATTGDPELSAAISNAVLCLYDDFINEFMSQKEGAGKTVNTKISSSGAIPGSPSNANSTRNALIFGIVGAILVCAILVIIFIFDDKIKTPDDVEKHLGLSVLGAIPEIEEA